mgnify:CR=1 FL=1
MPRFERIPATIAQTADRYYQLRADGIVTIGGSSKSRLAAWARSHGFAPSFVDERKREMRVEHGL